jgi:hypothetical protein
MNRIGDMTEWRTSYTHEVSRYIEGKFIVAPDILCRREKERRNSPTVDRNACK